MADSLNNILSKTTPDIKKDDEDLGPCAAIAKDKWIRALTIKHAKGPWESYLYYHLAVRSEYEPTRFWVEFVGDEEKWRVTVTGRNLERLYMVVLQGRIEWIRAAERDFADDGKVIILRIDIEKVDN